MVSLASVPVTQLKPRTIVFAETRLGDKADSPAEMIPFDEWMRDRPVQRRFLAMLPDFREPLVKEGGTARLSMYVAEARFRLPKPAQAFDLKRYASIAFLEGLDPAVKHTAIASSDIPIIKESVAGVESDSGTFGLPKNGFGRAALSAALPSARYFGSIWLMLSATSFEPPSGRWSPCAPM